MKIVHCILFSCCIIWGHVSAWGDSLAEIQSDSPRLSPRERIDRLEGIQGSASESDKHLIELLLTDARYEIEKRRLASQMLLLAKERLASISSEDESSFAREAVQYDVLSILQQIPLKWLSSSDQQNAVRMFQKIEESLLLANSSNAPPINHSINNELGKAISSIEDAIEIVNLALEHARQEDLSLITEAEPNGVLNRALEECESAREMLMDHPPNASGAPRKRWEAAMIHLGDGIAILKQRQILKYALWAEGRYRETDPTNIAQDLEEQKSKKLYKRLSEVNVSLVAEPSLAREIPKRLYELYDSINSLDGNRHGRYDAIIRLERRKTLDDF